MFYLPPPKDMVLFLDIDGTLLDFADTPSMVFASDFLIDGLNDLRAMLDDALAFVSGRMLVDVDALFSPLCLPGAFSHGGEIRDPECRVVRTLADVERISAVVEMAVDWSRKHVGVHVENKGDAVAMHYRIAPEKKAAVAHFAQEMQQILGEEYHLLEGSSVVELKPVNRNKALAIGELLRFPQWADRIPVFVGDDVTDEDGFKMVNALGGVSIKVGTGVTQATCALSDPRAVRYWLRSLVSAVA